MVAWGQLGVLDGVCSSGGRAVCSAAVHVQDERRLRVQLVLAEGQRRGVGSLRGLLLSRQENHQHSGGREQ